MKDKLLEKHNALKDQIDYVKSVISKTHTDYSQKHQKLTDELNRLENDLFDLHFTKENTLPYRIKGAQCITPCPHGKLNRTGYPIHIGSTACHMCVECLAIEQRKGKRLVVACKLGKK